MLTKDPLLLKILAPASPARLVMVEGSLEVQLPTIWTVEKMHWLEFYSQKKEDTSAPDVT